MEESRCEGPIGCLVATGTIVEQSEIKEMAIPQKDGPKTCRYRRRGEPYHKLFCLIDDMVVSNTRDLQIKRTLFHLMTAESSNS